MPMNHWNSGYRSFSTTVLNWLQAWGFCWITVSGFCEPFEFEATCVDPASVVGALVVELLDPPPVGPFEFEATCVGGGALVVPWFPPELPPLVGEVSATWVHGAGTNEIGVA